MTAPTRRAALTASLLSAVAGVPMAAGAETNPDAVLLAACAEHLAARAAVNAGRDMADDDPAILRYSAAFAAVDNAPTANTMAGILALARSAAAESRTFREGPRTWDDPSGAWAGDAVLSLLRLHGEVVE